MRNRVLLLITVLVLLAGFWIFYQTASVATRGGEGAPLYSLERHDLYGTAALFDLLTERGARTAVARQPAPRVLTESGGGAIMIRVIPVPTRGIFQAGGDVNEERVRRWTETGNTVIMLTRFKDPQDLRTLATIEASKELEAAESAGKPPDELPRVAERIRWQAMPGPHGSAIRIAERGLWMDSVQTFLVEGNQPWQTLAVNADGKPVAAMRTVGAGRLIIIGSPTMVLNGTLGDGENLKTILELLNAAAGKDILAGTVPIYFDEFSHGMGREGSIITFIREIGLLPVILQLILVIALYVWSTSGYAMAGRMGAPRRRSSAEQIETLGHLYSQSLKAAVVFDKVHTEVRRRIASVLRCAPAALESVLPSAEPAIQDRARRAIAHLEEAGRPALGAANCDQCGYDLVGNTSGRCPECGTPYDWRKKEQIARANETASMPNRSRLQRRSDLRLAAALRESYQLVQEHARERNTLDSSRHTPAVAPAPPRAGIDKADGRQHR